MRNTHIALFWTLIVIGVAAEHHWLSPQAAHAATIGSNTVCFVSGPDD